MKKILSYLLLFLSVQLSAQISFTITSQNVQCNNTEYGKIAINVTSSDPPYTYSWNSGQTTSFIDGLTLGDYSCTITDGSGDDTLVIVYIGIEECNMKPNLVITPNGDEIHDLWFIDNSEYFPNARVMIFNRLGQKVFEHSGMYEPWDGKDMLGRIVPDASYFYIIYQKDSDDSTILKGSVTVIR